MHNRHLAAAALSHRFDDDVPVPFLCECDDEECQEYAPLTLPEFHEWEETLIFTAPEHVVARSLTISQTYAYELHMTARRH